MSRKTPSFDQLTAYMLAPEGAQIDLEYNLPIGTRTEAEIAQAFEENHAFLPRRVNGNAMYHEILALEPNEAVSREEQIAALRQLAARYVDKRAPQQLAIGVIHAETPHIHIHLMISSNAVLSKSRVRLAKKEFGNIQREIEEYRIQHFPELGTRRYFDKSKKAERSSNREKAATLRTGQPSHKEELTKQIMPILAKAKSREEMEEWLYALGLKLYQRGWAVGVTTEGSRRYRFSTLGLSEAYTEAMARIELVESRIQKLQRSQHERDLEGERG